MPISLSAREKDSRANVYIQMAKSVLVLVAIGLLFAWQFDFISHAILAHPELNLLIIGVFFFGVMIAFSSFLDLFNEYNALQAMKETWADFDDMERTGDHEGVNRLMRAAEPARLFSLPRILGPIYELVMAELLKTRTLNASLAQRNTLMAMFNDGFNREKSLVNYITGTMILMGLIGTFIGLMEMVASVGSIVGGLAKVGAGTEDAIKKVIQDLEAPLTGMATGFSASLFGLFGSLSLGLIARFNQSATQGIKKELEHWLSRISAIETHGGGVGATNTFSGETAALAGVLLGAFRTTQTLIARSSDIMKRLGDRQEVQTDVLSRLVEHVESLSQRQNHALTQMKRLDHVVDSLEGLREDSILRDRLSANRLADSTGRVIQSIGDSRASLVAAVSGLSEQQRGTDRLLHDLDIKTSKGFDSVALELSAIAAAGQERGRIGIEHQSEVEKLLREATHPIDVRAISDQLSASVDDRLAAGFGAIATSFDDSLSKLAAGLDRLGTTQADLVDRLITIESDSRPFEELRAFGSAVEQGLSAGLSEIARVLDGIVVGKAAEIQATKASEQAVDHGNPEPDSLGISRAVNEAILERFRLLHPKDDAA
jgi:hypothetical protein